MKQYFLIPILLISIALSAQRYDPYGTVGQYNQVMESGEKIWMPDQFNFLKRYVWNRYQDNPNDLESFARAFFRELELRIPMLDSENSLHLYFSASDIKFTFQSFDDGTIAIAKSPGDRNYEIVIDPQRWNQAYVAEKVWIMWHELAHEFFATKHGQGGGMMFPISPGTDISLDRLYNGANSMFDWLVENKEYEIKRLHQDFEIVDDWD